MTIGFLVTSLTKALPFKNDGGQCVLLGPSMLQTFFGTLPQVGLLGLIHGFLMREGNGIKSPSEYGVCVDTPPHLHLLDLHPERIAGE